MRFAAESGPPQREETAARRAGQRRRRARTPRAKRTEVAGGAVVGAVFCVEVDVDIVRTLRGEEVKEEREGKRRDNRGCENAGAEPMCDPNL